MSNPYYTVTGYPQTGAPGASAPARNEFALIAAGFAKFPDYTAGAPGQVLQVNAGLTGYELVGDVARTDQGNTFSMLNTFSAGIATTGINTSSHTEAAAVSGSWYTAIPNASFTSVIGQGLWIVWVTSQNTASGVFLLDCPTTVVPVITMTTLKAGTYAAAQIDGSGNFQIQQNSGSPAVLTAIWLRIGS